jgi:predicted ester cyclase
VSSNTLDRWPLQREAPENRRQSGGDAGGEDEMGLGTRIRRNTRWGTPDDGEMTVGGVRARTCDRLLGPRREHRDAWASDVRGNGTERTKLTVTTDIPRLDDPAANELITKGMGLRARRLLRSVGAPGARAARRARLAARQPSRGGRRIAAICPGGETIDDVKRNIETVRRLEEALNRRDYSDFGELLADSFQALNPGSKQTSLDELQANNESWYGAFPDKSTKILDIFGEGDRVVARIRDCGTNTGGVPWFGIPANGRAMDIEWFQISRHEIDGRIAEMWTQTQVPRLLMQLGAIPELGV